jgi:hypothetical protein
MDRSTGDAMPLINTDRSRPAPWQDFRQNAFHRLAIPFLFSEWLAQWAAYGLSHWTLLEVLEYAGRFSVLVAVIFYFAESGERVKTKHYQAWQVINTAQGKGGSGGRTDALGELNDDHVPLIGVDVSDAFLQGVRLEGADLRRSNFSSSDMRDSQMADTHLEEANFNWTNLRRSDLRRAVLSKVNFTEADLTGTLLSGTDWSGITLDKADLVGADLQGIVNWQAKTSVAGTNIFGVKNAPAGFVEWAMKNGAISKQVEDGQTQ